MKAASQNEYLSTISNKLHLGSYFKIETLFVVDLNCLDSQEILKKVHNTYSQIWYCTLYIIHSQIWYNTLYIILYLQPLLV